MRTALLAPALAAALLTGGAVAGPAMAAKPEIERFPVSDSFEDPWLAEQCGVDSVTVAVEGQRTTRTFTDGTGNLQFVNTVNIGFVATAGENSVRFRDVGADTLRTMPDGTLVLSVIGQIPFDFRGVLKINLDTGETILEPQSSFERDVARACRALGG